MGDSRRLPQCDWRDRLRVTSSIEPPSTGQRWRFPERASMPQGAAPDASALLHSRRARAREEWEEDRAPDAIVLPRVSIIAGEFLPAEQRAIGSDRGYSAVERGAVSSRENSRRASLSGWMSASAPFHSVKNVSYDFRADSISLLIAAARAWPRYASG